MRALCFCFVSQVGSLACLYSLAPSFYFFFRRRPLLSIPLDWTLPLATQLLFAQLSHFWTFFLFVIIQTTGEWEWRPGRGRWGKGSGRLLRGIWNEIRLAWLACHVMINSMSVTKCRWAVIPAKFCLHSKIRTRRYISKMKWGPHRLTDSGWRTDRPGSSFAMREPRLSKKPPRNESDRHSRSCSLHSWYISSWQ